MAEDTPTYDLMILLSTTVEDDRRAKILTDVESAISGGGGTIVHNGDWGTRPMTYEIQHQEEAEYHLLQFNGPTSLLEALRHNLAITDGVLRSRIIKVIPGTPPPPTPSPPPARTAAPPTADAHAAPAAQAAPAEPTEQVAPAEQAAPVAPAEPTAPPEQAAPVPPAEPTAPAEAAAPPEPAEQTEPPAEASE